ncbi:MAG: hypothetical protein KJ000_24135 [Pirellulaceae bacterium]|nr:hypothetical protein [Pirellulaceae bacterium]
MLSEKARRHLLGFMALVFLGLATVLLTIYRDGTLYALGSMCLRIGLTLGVLWFALPQVLVLTRNLSPRLTVAVVLGGLIVVATRGKATLLVLLVLVLLTAVEVAGWLLNPTARKKGRR